MKVVQINAFCGSGSTGKIAVDISKMLSDRNIENYILYTNKVSLYPQGIKYAKELDIKANALKAKVLGNYGFNSVYMTEQLIKKLEEIKPDVIQLHNLHGHNVNLEILFTYLKKLDVKIIWTFHDCWAFTGYCMYFDYCKCNKWTSQCNNCIQSKKFSIFSDRSRMLYEKKKRIFTGFKDMTIVTPSEWMAKLVKQSFLKDYPVKVINNGIDLDVFRPQESDFRERYKIGNKYMILGVAMGFNERKGYKYFLELAKLIDDNTVIVMIGVNGKQISELPENVIGIEKTADQNELAQIYSAADVFLNCTLEDNFPTVNLEALACGTAVITFNTGGSIESVDEKIGAIVEQEDLESVCYKIKEWGCQSNVSDLCRQIAAEKYDAQNCYDRYVKLYEG